MNWNFKGVSKETWIRTATLALALINQVLVSCGFTAFPYEVTDLYEVGSAVVTVVLSIWAWWKNNSLTEEAQAADGAMNALKEEAKSEKAIIETDEKLED